MTGVGVLHNSRNRQGYFIFMNTEDRNKFESLTEADLHDRLSKYFSNWFDVQFEITSDCRKRRIDILMFHHSDNEKLYPIGIELKKTGVKRGGDIAKWCMQAKDYTTLSFKGFKPTVFIAPQISGWYLDEGERISKHDVELSGYMGSHNNVNSFLYQSFGFGELQKYYYKNIGCMRLVINTFIIWDCKEPSKLNYSKLQQCR